MAADREGVDENRRPELRRLLEFARHYRHRGGNSIRDVCYRDTDDCNLPRGVVPASVAGPFFWSCAFIDGPLRSSVVVVAACNPRLEGHTHYYLRERCGYDYRDNHVTSAFHILVSRKMYAAILQPNGFASDFETLVHQYGLTPWVVKSADDVVTCDRLAKTILLVVNLPNLAGMAAVEGLRKCGVLCPIFLMSEFSDTWPVERLRASNILDVWAKPLDGRRLATWLDTICGHALAPSHNPSR